jgi:hypothetical protein
MFKTTILLLALLFGAVGSAMADGITYDVTVDTSGIAGTSGSLDFQFNPGPLVTQTANLQIQNFTSDGTLVSSPPSPTLTGDVAGALPGIVTFDNGGAFNDYFTGFTYGSSLSFLLNLYGPAVTSPDGISTSGSAFSFSMYSDPGGTTPVLTSDSVNGYALAGAINLDGTATITNNSSQLTITTPVTATPEPNALLLLGSGLASLVFLRRKLNLSRQDALPSLASTGLTK